LTNRPTVLITGATGNLGSKLRRHLEGRYELRLIDIDPRGDGAVVQADLSRWNEDWIEQFEGAGTIVHLAADPTAHQTWPRLVEPNIDAVTHVYLAAARARVSRVIYASSNHVMGGYQEDPEPARITTEIPPRPGTRYVVDGQPRDSTPYATAKLFGERLGKSIAESTNVSVIAVRIGWVRGGENRASEIPAERGTWFRLMWLSNRDYCQLIAKCIDADPAIRFAVINGMSRNSGMRWDIEYTRQLVGYQPEDDVAEES
jgi:nucleoside-diphosphate-sugar epimerase